MVDGFCLGYRFISRWRSPIVRNGYCFARQSFGDSRGRAVVCWWPIICGRDRFRFRLRMGDSLCRKRRGLNQSLSQRLRWQRRSPEYGPCPDQG